MRLVGIAAAVVLVLAGCVTDGPASAPGGDRPCPDAPSADVPSSRPLCVVTSDGWTIRGEMRDGGDAAGPLLVLVHGLNESRTAFGALARDVAGLAAGLVLVDLRGHGESLDRGGVATRWTSLAPDEFAAMDRDVAAAVGAGHAAFGTRTAVLVGASIGANLAIRQAGATMEVNGTRAVVMLSPGLDYRGVSAVAANAAYAGRVLYAASEEDRYAMSSIERLGREGGSYVKDAKIWRGKGHGTSLLDEEGRAFVARWLATTGAPA